MLFQCDTPIPSSHGNVTRTMRDRLTQCARRFAPTLDLGFERGRWFLHMRLLERHIIGSQRAHKADRSFTFTISDR